METEIKIKGLETIGNCRKIIIRNNVFYKFAGGSDRQGVTYHNFDVFFNNPDHDTPCYVAETVFEDYDWEDWVITSRYETRNSIVHQCGGNEKLATKVFCFVDWQNISTALDEWENEGEIKYCKCGYCVDRYADWDSGNVPPDMTEDELSMQIECPKCGKIVDFEE